MKQRSLSLPAAAAALLLAACGSGTAKTTTINSATTPTATVRAAVPAAAAPSAPSAPGWPSAPPAPPPPSASAPAAAKPSGTAAAAKPTPTQDPSAPPELTLATLQKKAQVDPKDPLVQQFAQQLDALSKKCPALSRTELATDTYTVNQGIVSSGANETILETITGINKVIPAGNQSDCPKAFATYAISRVKAP